MADRGIVMLAQNSEDDYVKQACVNAMSIHATNPDARVSLVTNDPVPEKYKQFFDYILKIPFGDQAKSTSWKIQNRWKIYHATPYDQTLVMDTDMLVLQDINKSWARLSNKDMFFTSKVKTYKGEVMQDEFYRKTFIANKLPNVYSALHYFQKNHFSYEFYTWLEQIVKNHEDFYQKHAPKKYQKHCSIDVSMAIVVKLLGIEPQVLDENEPLTFVHMKANNQGWEQPVNEWLDKVPVYQKPNLELKLGNFKQDTILHYTEKSFVDIVAKKYEDFHNV